MTSGLVIFILQCAILILYHPLNAKARPITGGSYGYVAAFSTRTRNSQVKWHGCAGTLISARHIMTTEKCSNVMPGETLLANFRFTRGKEVHVKEIPISKITTYSDWFKDTYKKIQPRHETFNVAILTLSESYGAVVPVKPIYKHKLVQGKNKYVFIGWHTEDDFMSPRDPRKHYLSMLSREDCEKRARENLPNCKGCKERVKFTLPPMLLCASTDEDVTLMPGDLGALVSTRSPDCYTKDVMGIILQTALPSYESKRQPILVLPLAAVEDFIKSLISGE